jgi:NodT family efflux transporter outer membrane factor (OMF) lipoprotein
MKRIPLKLFNPARTAAAALSLLLSACMVGPDYKQPAAPASQHYDTQAEQQLGSGTLAQHVAFGKTPDGDWWSAFGSNKLDQVMHQAVAGNLDLEAADATIAQAGEAVTATRGGLSPQLDFGAQVSRQRTIGQPGLPFTANLYTFGPQVSFDFDVFGGIKRQIEEESALADLRQHRFDAAYLVVTGDVASEAFTLASARAQIEAVQVLLADDRKNLELVRTAHQYGSATQVDIALATTQLEQDETLLPPLAKQQDAARHALSALTGKGPADWVPPDFDLADFTLPADLPVSLPSELARQRPDILAAEAQLHAASGAVGVATADLYPHLKLSAAVSHGGPIFGTLWDAAAGLSAPVFHGGSLEANRRAAVDGYKASLAVYQQTVVQSLTQVADVLQAINHDTEEYQSQQRALSAAETSLRLQRAGYRAGETGVLSVLDAERAYQRALIGEIQAKTALYLDTAQLSIALGGNSSGAFERRVASRNEQ